MDSFKFTVSKQRCILKYLGAGHFSVTQLSAMQFPNKYASQFIYSIEALDMLVKILQSVVACIFHICVTLSHSFNIFLYYEKQNLNTKLIISLDVEEIKRFNMLFPCRILKRTLDSSTHPSPTWVHFVSAMF